MPKPDILPSLLAAASILLIAGAGAPRAQMRAFPGPIHTWKAGVVAGVNLANADVDNYSSRSETGLILGARAEWEPSRYFGFILEPKWVQKGAELEAAGQLFDSRGKFHFLEFPLLAKAGLVFNSLTVQAVLGPVLGVQTAVQGQLDSARRILSDDINLFEFGLETGGGVSFWATDRIDLVLDARYFHGLRNILNGPVGNVDYWRSRDVRIQAGVVFKTRR